uniref:Uncharacterized protein n=1 Tax=Leptospirillum sp. Group II '5-way CG' TaxID=419541 RepID=B6AP68_9BACT|nr:MAG: Hypothetical protein CGL2_10284008 [Leptospirillum sp. Group II '5-way CG']
MKLKEYTVREFRSIWDSGAVKVDDQTTCLVGKTTLLAALYQSTRMSRHFPSTGMTPTLASSEVRCRPF